MTKKDFQLIADALKDANADRHTCKIMAVWLFQTNPRFDEGRFLQACGPWENDGTTYKRVSQPFAA